MTLHERGDAFGASNKAKFECAEFRGGGPESLSRTEPHTRKFTYFICQQQGNS